MNRNWYKKNSCILFDQGDDYSAIFRLEILKLVPNNMYILHKNYLDKIIPEWDSDTVIMDLVFENYF